MQNRWQKIWEARELSRETGDKGNTLEKLLQLDGMDTGFGSVDADSWQHYINNIMQRTGVDQGSQVFEVGCGAGAFLYPIYRQGISVAGADYSKNLLSYATVFMPSGKFHHADAADQLPARSSHVFSSGVFMYFSDMAYAETVLQQMLAGTSDTIAILDIPDKQKKNEAIEARRLLYTGDDYDSHYAGLNHLYFEKNWFYQTLKRLGCSEIEIEDQEIEGYCNTHYRFNVFAKR